MTCSSNTAPTKTRYLKRTFDKYRGTFASLQCAWDDEHLDAIQTLALHFEGSFGHAMQQVKQKLCADPSAEDSMRVMKVPGEDQEHYADCTDRSDKGLIAMANTAASAMVAWCRMPNGQTGRLH